MLLLIKYFNSNEIFGDNNHTMVYGGDVMSNKKPKDTKITTTKKSENTIYNQPAQGSYKTDIYNKPSPETVIDAKEWVDHGSLL